MRLLITAGPTYEPIDAVRFLGNRSSGKLGSTLADTAAVSGWEVTILLGPNALQPTDPAVQVVRFQSSQNLQDLLDLHLSNCDCLIMAAAVSDFRPEQSEVDPNSKRARSEGGLSLKLESTPDLLAHSSSEATSAQLLIGFALEPQERLIASAESKLRRKNIDLIVANELGTMNDDSIKATLIGNPDRGINLTESTAGKISKTEFAGWLLEHITPIARDRAGQSESSLYGQS